MRAFRKIIAWQKADDLAVRVYGLTESFPKSEIHGLTSQIRRAAVSVAANITEGSARATSKDYVHFLIMARSSLAEVEYYLHLSHRLGHIDGDEYQEMAQLHEESAKVLYGLVQHIQRQMKTNE